MLLELIDQPVRKSVERSHNTRFRLDALLEAGPYTFAVEWKKSGAVGPVSSAVEAARQAAAQFGDSVIPLVAVPFMGDAGRSYCEQVSVAWIDLSGNAHISGPGLRIRVIGRRNRFLRRGRPESAFAHKASRVARWLLIHPKKAMSQREISMATGLDEGYTSRVVWKLIDDGLVRRDDGGIRPQSLDLLLDAWNDEYRFDRHTIIRGHVAARTGTELIRRVSQTLDERQWPYAVTGLGAAWLLTHQAGFRLGTIYLGESPPSDLIRLLGFREEPRGANTWLVMPSDAGVFHGASEREGVRCVHPVQAYIDLKDQPERAREAATELRSRFLQWSNDSG